jgi:hypothetical protein
MRVALGLGSMLALVLAASPVRAQSGELAASVSETAAADGSDRAAAEGSAEVGVEPGGYLPKARPRTDESDADAQRNAWTRRGGIRASYEVRLLATGLLHPDRAFSENNPVSGEIEYGRADQFGIGGGLGVRAAMMYLSLPAIEAPSSVLTAFRLGAGLDGILLYSKLPNGFTYRGDGQNIVGRAVDRDDEAFFFPII